MKIQSVTRLGYAGWFYRIFWPRLLEKCKFHRDLRLRLRESITRLVSRRCLSSDTFPDILSVSVIRIRYSKTLNFVISNNFLHLEGWYLFIFLSYIRVKSISNCILCLCVICTFEILFLNGDILRILCRYFCCLTCLDLHFLLSHIMRIFDCN